MKVHSSVIRTRLQNLVDKGWSISAACRELGVPNGTGYRWIAAARRGEPEGAASKRYEKTPKGFLMRAYRNMQSRVEGVQKAKAHLYVGKELAVTRDQFYAWSSASSDFTRLFTEWVKAGYDRRLTPSVDRIDPSIGYRLDNMRWITHAANSALGSLSRRSPKSEQRAAIYAAAGIQHGKA